MAGNRSSAEFDEHEAVASDQRNASALRYHRVVSTEPVVAGEPREPGPAADTLDDIVSPGAPHPDRAQAADRTRVHAALFGAREPEPNNAATATPRRRFGRYEVVEKIGEGAMGEVFRAVDPLLQRQVAIKCVHPRLAGEGDRGIGRLLQEARSLARLDHPNVVRVFEAGIDDAYPWIAMEYVDGTNLREWLSAAKRSASEIMRCLVEAGRGLAAAHDAGLVHRDFKPDNVLVDKDGRAKVGDFGLVRALLEPVLPSSPTSERPGASSGSASASLTRDGAIVGTPAYMPPEQLAGDPVDATGDQFAFCVTAWEALFGARPFGGVDPMELCAAILAGNLRKRRGGVRVRRGVERALRRGLSARTVERFSTMSDLLRRLEPSRLRVGFLAAGPVLLATAVASGQWDSNDAQRCDRAEAEAALGGAWDSAQKEAVAAAIERSGLPYRGVTSRAVIHALDERTASWVASWQSTCTAAETRVESQARIDRKVACLQARRAETAATVRRLESGDPRSLAAGRDAVERLPGVDVCEALDDDVPLVSSEVAQVIDPLLATGRALRLGGHPAASLGPLQIAQMEGVRLHATAMSAEAAIELGLALRELGDISGAVAMWHRAVDLGVAAADERLQASAWFALTQSAANDLRDAARAREWLQHGSAVATRVSEGDALEIQRELCSALVSSIASPAEALAAIEDIGRRWADDETIDAASRSFVELAARHRASLLLDLGRWDEAAAEYHTRIAEDVARYGDGHPRVADAWLGLGIALDRSGDIEGDDGAEAAYLRAAEIWNAAWPDGHRDIGAVEIALANVAQRRRDFHAAGRHADAAMAMYRKVIGNELDAAFGEAWTVQGVVEHRRGEFEGAARSHDAARRVYEATSGVDSVGAAMARSNAAEARLMGILATARSGRGGTDLEAELDSVGRDVQASLASIREAVGPSSAILGYPAKVDGMLKLYRGDVKQARSAFDAALRLCDIDPIECAAVEAYLREISGQHPSSRADRGDLHEQSNQE